MHESLLRKTALLLLALVRRRSYRGWWAYLIFLPFYLFMACWFAGDVNLSPSRQWPLLIPAAIITAQWIWPTILGWIVIFAPVFLYSCNYALLSISDSFGSDPLWKRDPGDFVLSLFVLALLFGVCAALVFALILSTKPMKAKAAVLEK